MTEHLLTCFQLEAGGGPGSPWCHRKRQGCDHGQVLSQVCDQLITAVGFQPFQHYRGGVDSVPSSHVISHSHVGGTKYGLHLTETEESE